MLISDGYNSHLEVDFVEYSWNNCIIPSYLPPHTTHLFSRNGTNTAYRPSVVAAYTNDAYLRDAYWCLLMPIVISVSIWLRASSVLSACCCLDRYCVHKSSATPRYNKTSNSASP